MKMSNKNNTKISRPSMCLHIPDSIYDKIMYWVNKTNYEVSWWGLLDYDKDTNVFTVMDIFLLDQEVSGASTEISANAIHKLMYETKDSPYYLRWWGHSHVKMDVFWSGTDMQTMTENSENGWLLSTVFNQKRELKTAFCQNNPVSLFVDNIDTKIVSLRNEDWDTEFELKVKTKKIVVPQQANVPSEYKWSKNVNKKRANELFSQLESNKKGQKKEVDLVESYDDDDLSFLEVEMNDTSNFTDITSYLKRLKNKPDPEDMYWWNSEFNEYNK